MTSELLPGLVVTLWLLSLVCVWAIATVVERRRRADEVAVLQHLLVDLRKPQETLAAYKAGLQTPNWVAHDHLFTRYAQRTKGKWDFWDCQRCGAERALPRHSSPFVKGQP